MSFIELDRRPADLAIDAAPDPAATPAATVGGPAIATLERASRRFGDIVAVRDLSLDIPSGTIFGVIGPSGSGKTTTIRMLTGALRPDSGRVVVFDRDPTRLDRRTRQRIGYLPQLSVLYPELTARENVDFVAALFGMLVFRRRRRVKEVLRVLGLANDANRRVEDLSGGMRRRVALGCALVGDPELLVLDEPTTGIDPILRESIWAELARLREAGHTIVVTTQYVSEAEQCDLVALIAEGGLVALDTPEALRHRVSAEEGTPVASRESRPPFDEVFADLVRQAAGANGDGVRTAGREMPS